MTKSNERKETILNRVHLWIVKNKLLVAVVVMASVTHLSITVFNGLRLCVKGSCGMYIGSLHYHDFLWHFGLAVNAFNSFPFTLPIFSGSYLKGYNFFIDMVLYVLYKIGIPVITSYFILLPIGYLILTAVLSYILLRKRNKNTLYIACGLFFIFFGSSFSYLLSLYHFHSWQSFMYAQAMQSGRALLNMSYAWSLPVLLLGMILLQKSKLFIKQILVLGFLLFVMFGLKFYGGVTLLFILIGNRGMFWIRNKNWLSAFEISIYGIACFIAYFLFFKTNSAAVGSFPFVFSPFSIVHPMIEEKDMFYMPTWVNARYFLESVKSFSPRLLMIELVTMSIFLVYNFGTRVVGIASLVKSAVKKTSTRMDAVLLGTIVILILITVLCIQKREWWNTIQFLGYALFLANFFAGEALYILLKSKKTISVFLAIVVILFTLPTNIEQVGFAAERHVSISQGELNGLSFLKQMPKGVVLVFPYEETSYVAAFAEKQLYIADKTQLYLLGIDYQNRMDKITNLNTVSINDQSIEYIYIHKEATDGKKVGPNYKIIYQNSEVIIYQKK